MDLTTAERELATKIGKSKQPRRALERAVGKGKDITDVLWRMLAAGALEFRGTLADAAGCCAERAKLDDVWRAVQHLDDAALREESVKWALENSYREHPVEWEAQLSKLPRIAHQLVAGVRHQAGVAILDADREHVLDTFAMAAVDKEHTYRHRLQQDAEELGASNREFGSRVLRYLDRLPADARLANYIDVIEALRFASWAVVAPLLRTVSGWDRANSNLVDMLRARDDSAVALFEALERADDPLPPDVAAFVLARAQARGEEPPEALDAILVDALANGQLDAPRDTAPIEALPAPRRERLIAALKATGTDAYACAGLLRDAALDDTIVAEIVAGATEGLDVVDAELAESNLTSTFTRLLGAGEHGIALIDRALAELAKLPAFAAWDGAAVVRLLCRRVQFAMTVGRTRRIELVLPGDDIERVNDIRDGVGHVAEPLQGLDPAQLATLRGAWARYDWDGRLNLDQVFGEDTPPPPIETRPWDELAGLVAVTSFRRLDRPEALPRVFGRAEPLAAKLELAERIAARANRSTGEPSALRAIARVLCVLIPHANAAGQPLAGELEIAAKRLLARDPDDDVRDLLLALPLAQVTAWIDELRASKSAKLQQLAGAYAKRLPA